MEKCVILTDTHKHVIINQMCKSSINIDVRGFSILAEGGGGGAQPDCLENKTGIRSTTGCT